MTKITTAAAGASGAAAPSRTAPPVDLRRYIVDVPDFPHTGILFRDITPLLCKHFAATLDALERLFDEHEWAEIDALAGIESRGFVLAAGLAARRGKGFVPIRKQGKLPPPVVSAAYALEYGSGVLEMQRGGGEVLLIDDVLATGGTMRASAELCGTAGYRVRGLAVLIDLRIVGEFAWNQLSLRSVIRYE
jgi:adenine phosphoribosyltransferase